MKLTILIAVLAGCMTIAVPAQAEDTAVPSSEDRARFLSINNELERAPLDAQLQDDRAWAIRWLDDAPDVSVTLCSDPLNGISGTALAWVPYIVTQYALGMGAYVVRHPQDRANADAEQLAGVESALKAYRMIRSAGPLSRAAPLEELLALQDRGELSAFVQKAFAHCQAVGKDAPGANPIPTEAATWKRIWKQPDVATIYVDPSSVRAAGIFRQILTRTVYQAPYPDGYIAERVRVEEFDCQRHRFRMRRSTIFARDGRAPQTVDVKVNESDWKGYEVDSLGAKKERIACASALPAA